MTAKFQPGDRVLVEAVVERALDDDTVVLEIACDEGWHVLAVQHVHDVPADQVHFVEAGAQ
jgi:hypothetical protein